MNLTGLQGVERKKAIMRMNALEVIDQLPLSKRAIAVGSGRKAYGLQDDKTIIVKRAFNECGVHQTHAEIVIYNTIMGNDMAFEEVKSIFPRVYTGAVEWEGTKDFSKVFLVMQRVKPLTYEKGTVSILTVSDQYGMNPMSFKIALHYLVKKHDLHLDDILDAAQWGLTTKGKLKLFDWGTTQEIYNRFYYD